MANVYFPPEEDRSDDISVQVFDRRDDSTRPFAPSSSSSDVTLPSRDSYSLDREGYPVETISGDTVASPRTSQSEIEAQPDGVLGKAAREFQRKAIVTLEDGEKIGEVEDLLFDPSGLRVAGLLVGGGGLFGNRSASIFPANAVQVWGKDAILVHASQMVSGSETQGWVRLSEQLRGRTVVDIQGTRIGQIADVLIDRMGRMAGYLLSQVFVEGSLAQSKRLPASVTYSMGKDVLVVDMSRAGTQDYR